MSFHVNDDQLLEKQRTICTRIEDLQNIELSAGVSVHVGSFGALQYSRMKAPFTNIAGGYSYILVIFFDFLNFYQGLSVFFSS